MTDTLMTTGDLVRMTGERDQTWRLRRMRGDGPPFVRIGVRAFYRREDVEEWLRGRTYRTTTEETTRRGSGRAA